ncbi:MAG: T9SS type A sorting domain-containing protein [Bacteroidia bacterium]|nr:T9SS type A sorting domain-containing protein [Bacteroidia bacterium]
MRSLFFIESAEDSEIELFNSLGQLVLQKTIFAGKQSIDLSEQATGIYFIKIRSSYTVFRFLKQTKQKSAVIFLPLIKLLLVRSNIFIPFFHERSLPPLHPVFSGLSRI